MSHSQILSVELEQVKNHIRFNGTLGLGLIQCGKFSIKRNVITWKGSLPTKVHVMKCGKRTYELVNLKSNEHSKIRYMRKGVYEILETENGRVRFFKPVDVPTPVVEVGKTIKPKSDKKVIDVKDKNADSDNKDYDRITEILANFAEKIDKDFNLMSVCDVDARKYAEDYVRRELKNQKFDVEGAVAEFDEFLGSEVKQSLKPEKSKKPISFTDAEFTDMFENKRKGPKVAELRELLIKRKVPGITAKSTKKEMKEIVETYICRDNLQKAIDKK
jgi:hypothetical protein